MLNKSLIGLIGVFSIGFMLSSCENTTNIRQNGSLINISTEAPGANCALGGQRIDVGLDLNANGVLDPSEITKTTYVCNAEGANARIVTSPFNPGDNPLHCFATGGVQLDFYSGTTLTSTQYVCNGRDGSEKLFETFYIEDPSDPQTTYAGVIDQNAGTIDVTVPFGTNVSYLVADFTTTSFAAEEVAVTINGGGQYPGDGLGDGTGNDFRNGPLTYIVTAQDSSTKTYIVTVAEPSCSTVVSFVDPNLELVIKEQLNIGISDPLCQEDLALVTELDAGGHSISDLTGLDQLTNLTTLNLATNNITDISVVGLLTNLTSLSLGGNNINNVSALGTLTNLTTLNLDYNEITNVSALGTLTNLTTLNLDYNEITNISALGTLTNLTTLNLSNNDITNISVLGSLVNLTDVYLDGNDISINDMPSYAVVSFPDTNLEQVIRTATSKPEGNIYKSDMGGLTMLFADSHNISDLTGLEYGMNLTLLVLSDNQITDISALASLTSLTGLGLSNTGITNISALGTLTNLTELYLSDNAISDISALASLTNLSLINLDNTDVVHISALIDNYNSGGLRGASVYVRWSNLDSQALIDAQTLHDEGVNIRW